MATKRFEVEEKGANDYQVIAIIKNRGAIASDEVVLRREDYEEFKRRVEDDSE